MPAEFKSVAGRGLLQQLLNVTAEQVLRRPTFDAEQVVVMSPVA
jgi:hypothetical protein